MGEFLARFQELLVQGSNSVLTSSDRNSISLEMRGLRDQLLNLANVQDAEGNQHEISIDITILIMKNKCSICTSQL